MADMTNIRVGQANGAGNALANFLEVYGGEVLTAFAQKTITKGRHIERTIQHGKSAQFPATWRVSAAYHVPGEEITGQASNANERTISIDSKLISDVFIPDIDEAISHFDYRSIYSFEAGEALATTFDKNVLRMAILAASTSTPTVTGAPAGTDLVNASYRTDSDILAGGLFDVAETMDGDDIPGEDRYCAMLPAQYYLLAQNTKFIDRDWTSNNGDLAKAQIAKVADIELLKTNLLPQDDYAGVSGEVNTYTYDNTDVAVACWQKKAVGTVKLRDLKIGSDPYMERWQGTLTVAKYLLGHGILRPECATTLSVA